MSNKSACPKCGANRLANFERYKCGSLEPFCGWEFKQSQPCRIAELEKENVKLRAEIAEREKVISETSERLGRMTE